MYKLMIGRMLSEFTLSGRFRVLIKVCMFSLSSIIALYFRIEFIDKNNVVF
jgi:hypothetical protein